MTKLWMFTCESCERKTATECDMFDAADVRCAMCGSALVDDKVDVVAVSSERLAALEELWSAFSRSEDIRAEAFPGLASEDEQKAWLKDWGDRLEPADERLENALKTLDRLEAGE